MAAARTAISSSPLGPWKNEPDGVLDGKDLCAAQIAFDGETPVLFGWIPLKPARPGKQTWGGHLALAREVVALPDGKLGTRLAGKLAGTFERLQWQPELGAWNNFVSEFALTIPEGPSEVRVSLLPRGEIVFTRDRLRILDATGECWSELPVDLRGTQPFATRLVMEKDIVEVFVGDRYSLVARIPASSEPLRLSVNPSSAASSIRFANW